MQDYKLVIRGLTTGQTVITNGVLDVQNVGEFLSYLNQTYLSQGYEVQKADLVRYIPVDTTRPAIYEFAYHLVKGVVEVEVPKTPNKTDK